MASPQREKAKKRALTQHELMHQMARFIKPELDEWMTVGARLRTFTDWPFDSEEGAKCTSVALAQAGFEMTDAEESAARCVCCAKEMLWESADDPFDEHKSHSPRCFIVLEGKPAAEMTILDYIRMSLWRSAFKKTDGYRAYIMHLRDSIDTARLRAHELLIDAERKVKK